MEAIGRKSMHHYTIQATQNPTPIAMYTSNNASPNYFDRMEIQGSPKTYLSESDQTSIAQAREAALAQAEVAFSKLDINGDGEVDRSEIMQFALAEQGQCLDDGASQKAKEAKIKEFLESFDADGDGKIQKEEWLAFFGNHFDSVIASGLNK